tara:strand:- start:5029 stop:6555 length:1527 start_codon:yes stop_codon:yes gene_type:complete
VTKTKGQIISGNLSELEVRQKSQQEIEIGELLISDLENAKILFQVYDIRYASQLSKQNLEMIAGLNLEEESDTELYDSHLRNYKIAILKSLIKIKDNKAAITKTLPELFSPVREISKQDLTFLTKPQNPLFLGNLRSGSKILEVPVYIQSDKAFSHHLLIVGTTGRGKSVFISNLLWSTISNQNCGALVLDPHDEYYGRNKTGLKDHNEKDKIIYYTSKNPPPGTNTLTINLENLRPNHFDGVINFSDPQKQALNISFKEFGKKWIEDIILEKPLHAKFRDDTLAVVKRRLLQLLDLDFTNNKLTCSGIFKLDSGENTINDIVKHLEESKIVIVDTSNFSGSTELLIGSLVASSIFRKYKYYKINGLLKDKPVISIVLEEAPRVLGKDILESGSNIFSTIAREGRKFKVGLTAITQLPSLIPREILANMNTKIILGIEMKPERQAIIDSAAQDLSNDDRTIASLDIGEALITSNFLKFVTPIKIPFFEDVVKNSKEKEKSTISFSELN